jgi:DNA repair photolyase
LPYSVAPLFEQWLGTHFPDRKDKVLNRIRSLRDGKLNNAEFGSRMRGEGIFAEQIERMFDVACRKAGLPNERVNLSTEHFRRPGGVQGELEI